MQYVSIRDSLKELLAGAPVLPVTDRDRIVVFSDFHLGDCSRKDDFRHNAELVKTVLENYYLEKGYRLILNGDIEELQKFSLSKIINCRRDLYRLLARFSENNMLIRLQGNHDYSLKHCDSRIYKGKIEKAVKLSYEGLSLLVFHGHQASNRYEKYNEIYGFFLRYIANPLRIRNRSAAYHSKRRYAVEKQVYRFSKEEKIVSIIGHTHRPLFESVSHADSLKFEIDQLCRNYGDADPKERADIEDQLRFRMDTLGGLLRKDGKEVLHSNIYRTPVIVPCVFNSGCAVGKRGVTCLEILDGRIALIHWFDSRRKRKRVKHYPRVPEQLAGSNFYRTVIRKESLSYIHARISLLADWKIPEPSG